MTTTDYTHLAHRLGPGNFRTIAKRSGLSPQHVARVIKGMKGARLETAILIAQAAGVTLDQLVAFREAYSGN